MSRFPNVTSYVNCVCNDEQEQELKLKHSSLTNCNLDFSFRFLISTFNCLFPTYCSIPFYSTFVPFYLLVLSDVITFTFSVKCLLPWTFTLRFAIPFYFLFYYSFLKFNHFLFTIFYNLTVCILVSFFSFLSCIILRLGTMPRKGCVRVRFLVVTGIFKVFIFSSKHTHTHIDVVHSYFDRISFFFLHIVTPTFHFMILFLSHFNLFSYCTLRFSFISFFTALFFSSVI